jgi:hypothetical protein
MNTLLEKKKLFIGGEKKNNLYCSIKIHLSFWKSTYTTFHDFHIYRMHSIVFELRISYVYWLSMIGLFRFIHYKRVDSDKEHKRITESNMKGIIDLKKKKVWLM